ncbi:hybrid signal transduction histidine kinase M [Tanacetum coccineum]
MWILGSLCDSLQEQVVTTPDNAKALWDHLQNLFHDNKDAKAINLDNELCSIKIKNMSINEYCTKIKSMADRLKNLGYVVSDKNLVIYAINGHDSRFATLVEIIRLPTFETARNMLLLKESSMNDQSGASTTFESSSSSPTISVATNSSDNKEDSDKDYELNLSMYGKATKIEKLMNAKLVWLNEKYNYSSQTHISGSSSQTHEIGEVFLTKKELHQLHLDEEALRETLEEQAMDEKSREDKIRQKQAADDEFFLEFGVVRYDSDYESSD